MRIQIKATFEIPKERQRFMEIMEHGSFEVTQLGPDVYCSFNGYVPDCLLRQLTLAVKSEYEARNNAIYRECLRASGVAID